MSRRADGPGKAPITARVHEIRDGRRRRQEIRRVQSSINEERIELGGKRERLRKSEEILGTMRAEQERLRNECFEHEQVILDGLARVVMLRLGERGGEGFPSFMRLEDVADPEGRGLRAG
jgi:hypothetical protein